VLSLLGGILVFLVGLLITFVGALVTMMTFGIGGIFGLWGVFCGIAMMYGAYMMNSHPEQHSTWGIVVVILSVLSWGSLGGFGLGFLMGLIGGILGILWQPSGAHLPATGSRYCPSCGKQVDPSAKFCPSCGRQLA
jgi:hypothetical protein